VEESVGEGRKNLMNSEKILLTVREVAALTGFAEGTLRHWISEQRGMQYVKISPRCIRFRRSDVEEWIAGLVVVPDSAKAHRTGRRGDLPRDEVRESQKGQR
jgi:excisionase family DNA binding protein